MTILFVILAVLLLIAAVITVGIYRFTFYSSPKNRTEPAYSIPDGEQYAPYAEETVRRVREIENTPHIRWETVSHDGLKLSARYYGFREGAPLDICFHGYRASAMRDFCGGFFLGRDLGHNVLLVDERACGKSEGSCISFGVNERYDVLAWCEEARKRLGTDTKILLCGVSMGAATVLMASELPLPENVKGIWADCPYDAPARIIRNTAKGMRLPADPLMPFAALGARLFGGFSVYASEAVTAVTRAKVPIEIVHGDDDRFVPYAMGEAIAEAGGLPLHTAHGAGHALSYMVDRKLYEEKFTAFAKRVTE